MPGRPADQNHHVQTLTVRDIAKLTPRAVQYVIWDDDVTGFGVRVSARAKSYIYKYRLPSGRVRWATLGRTDKIPLDKARRRARSMAGAVADGKDPQDAKDTAKGAILTRDVAEQFLAEHVEVHLGASTSRHYRSHMDLYIRPLLGAVPIAEITSAHAAKLQYRLRDKKQQANRVLATLSSLCTWCERKGYREVNTNPCQRIRSFAPNHRERYLSADELKRLGAALRVGERYRRLSPSTVAIMKLLVFTGARAMEVCALRWDEVDLTLGQIKKPRKRGSKPIYLNPPAVQVLTEWPRWAGSPYVFPGTGRKKKGEHRVIPSKAWKWIRKRARLKDARVHDLRHSFASVAVSGGQTLPVIGALLGHTQAQTTLRYAHLMDDPLRAASEATGGTIAASLLRPRTRH